MNSLNTMHPVVRYGVAAAYVRAEMARLPFDWKKEEDLYALAIFALEDALSQLVLAPYPGADADTVVYQYLSGKQLLEKAVVKRSAANGFFTGPHVLTSNNVKDVIKEVDGLLKLLKDKQYDKSVELKRSFAPVISKINAGGKSLSNPKVSLLEAAYTAVATVTTFKPAAFVKELGDKFSNAGIIPDLPFETEGEQPMIAFVRLFRQLQAQGTGTSSLEAKPTKAKKYPRPSVFYGNYPHRPTTFGLGIVSLLAAIGKWAEEQEDSFVASSEVLQQLENQPIYLISYNNIGQQRFGHHLTKLAQNGTLHLILSNLSKVSIVGVEDNKKFDDPKWLLFKDVLDKFLRFFNRSSWRDFLAVRASYPFEFFHLLNAYFMKEEGKYPQEIINAAVAYGETLNKAAFQAAQRETSDDKKRKIDGRSIKEYKQRMLLQLESIIDSAKNNQDLVARLNSQIGRFTHWDINTDATPFLKAVANNQVEQQDAKDLVKAFMRLSTYNPAQAEEEQA